MRKKCEKKSKKAIERDVISLIKLVYDNQRIFQFCYSYYDNKNKFEITVIHEKFRWYVRAFYERNYFTTIKETSISFDEFLDVIQNLAEDLDKNKISHFEIDMIEKVFLFSKERSNSRV